MKNVVILLAGSNAVVVSEKQYKSGKCKVFSASTTTASALQALNFVMSLASTNETIDKEIVRIYIPDVIKGFAMGTYVDYIRTGKTSGNRKFTEEEFALVKECALNICNRGLNLKVAETKFMPKELKEFKDGAFKIAKQMKEELANKPQQVVSAPVDPRIAKLQELMVKALDDGDFDKYDALEERLNKITQGQPAPQVQQSVEEPAEEDNEVVVDNTEEEENADEPEEVDVDEDLANLDI